MDIQNYIRHNSFGATQQNPETTAVSDDSYQKLKFQPIQWKNTELKGFLSNQNYFKVSIKARTFTHSWMRKVTGRYHKTPNEREKKQ